MEELNYINGVDLDKYMAEKMGTKPIRVGGKEFVIATFPTISNIEYNKYTELSKQSIDNYKEALELVALIEKSKDKDAKKKLVKKLDKIKATQITDDDIRKPMNDCLKYMLEANGYKYDALFWQKNCDDLKLGMFIHLASNSGVVDELLKKKKD